ncbi:fructosamine kinase family protein [Halobacillus sp. Marseille-Q1614]|uniref:fructosamine kinase family protein n=1 Tax=Halobacillus sp. Marseille-Q1614 TaxID=2709134 RepID=UPI00156D6B27|nr:fructosamine kinase family protein [Halobacillus sp. Marseille-Q1614]
MKKDIERVVQALGDSSAVKNVHQVSGGDINQAFYVKTEEQEYFIKGNQNVPSHFFKAEAEGLKLIKETRTAAVPEVYYYDEPKQGEAAMLAMKWVEGEDRPHTAEVLGRKLAEMHNHKADRYGFGLPTFVGTMDQPNEWRNTWLEYYRDCRLKEQLEIGLDKGNLPLSRQKNLEWLIEHLDVWIPASPSPSLLHGDLWGGNFIAGPKGEPYLIDPSVLYGDPCFELAFTELFGGFSQDFYTAYKEVSPLPSDYEDIRPLYQLFYLLVHLNMFGESYGPSVDQILKRFTK